MTKQDRYYNIDLLRILCCFGVVLIHEAADVWFGMGINTFSWNMAAILDISVRFAVPLFFMISGCLFLKSSKEINIKKIFTKNIFKLVIILIVWLSISGIVSYHRYGYEITEFKNIVEIFHNIIDDQYQFWFLLPLISIYICLPFLKKISENKKVLKYFLILFFVFQILIPTFIAFINDEYTLKLLKLITPNIIMGYYGYFLLGHYLDVMKLKPRQIKTIYILGISSLLFATLGTVIASYNTQTKFSIFLDYYQLTTFITSIFIFIFFKYKIGKIKFSEKSCKIIKYISNCTMGIYVLHFLVKWSLEYIGINVFFTNALIAVPLMSLLICVISIFLTLLIKKIPIIGKYII